ncbi:MAG: sigma-54-dependent Fis family transcriptional regulator [Desulfobacteraceae bacterium]|nr:MAG: sigma-54-dependent Fis family transcriptional regulator [Desulfobacteraceae bacterium]
MKSHIVIIDDEPIALKRLRRILEKEGCRVAAFSRPGRALAYLQSAPCDLVISDVKMPEMSGMELMARVRGRFPDLEMILITGYATLDGAVEAAKEGAFHYLAKPFTPDQLRERVKQALAQAGLKAQAQACGPSGAQIPIIVGKSPKIRQVEAFVRQIAPADCNVLITGDSGTGKELVARSLHAFSRRAKGPFVAFNCAALAENLIENELFGHEKGAYTGADQCCPGLLEAAGGGTLFLDEIGEMPQSMQIKLLRVLQEKELLRVGGRRPIPLDVRIVSATSKDVKAAVAGGAMRSDFLFRINIVTIQMPALSERREDIPLLAYHLLNRMQRGGKTISAISEKALDLLCHYAFPGNVRELENILARAVAVCQGNTIRTSDLPPDLSEFQLQEYRPPEGALLTLEAMEQDYIAHVLKLTDGARTRAAEILGIDRASLWRKIKKYGLD